MRAFFNRALRISADISIRSQNLDARRNFSMETPEYFLIRNHPDGGFAALAGYDLDGPDPEAILSDWRFPNISSASNWAKSLMPHDSSVRLHSEVQKSTDEPLILGADWTDITNIADDMFGVFANRALDALEDQDKRQSRAENEWASPRGKPFAGFTNLGIISLEENPSSQFVKSQEQSPRVSLIEGLPVNYDPNEEVARAMDGSSLSDEQISDKNHPLLVADAMFSLSDLVRSRASSLSKEFSVDYIKGLRRAGGIIENEARIYTRSRVLGVADPSLSIIDGLHQKLSALIKPILLPSRPVEAPIATEVAHEYPPSDLDAEVLAIADMWQLDAEQTIILLNNNNFRRTATIHQISMALVFSSLPINWMTIPNDTFDGKSPISLIEEQGIDGLTFIHEHLDQNF
jgi:hypothetical protein